MATPALTFVLIKRLSNLRLILLYLVKDLMDDFLMNAKFSSLLMECNSHLFSLCFIYLYEGEGGVSSGSLLSLCLGEPEDGVVRVFLFLNVIFASPCFLVVYVVFQKILFIKNFKKR